MHEILIGWWSLIENLDFRQQILNYMQTKTDVYTSHGKFIIGNIAQTLQGQTTPLQQSQICKKKNLRDRTSIQKDSLHSSCNSTTQLTSSSAKHLRKKLLKASLIFIKAKSNIDWPILQGKVQLLQTSNVSRRGKSFCTFVLKAFEEKCIRWNYFLFSCFWTFQEGAEMCCRQLTGMAQCQQLLMGQLKPGLSHKCWQPYWISQLTGACKPPTFVKIQKEHENKVSFLLPHSKVCINL